MTQILDAAALKPALVYAALLILMLPVLAGAVIARRRSRRIGLGDGGDKDLARWVRIHGNFAETAPFGIAALSGLALSGAGAAMVHVIGAGFLLGRVAHAQGLASAAGYSAGRSAGMVLTLATLIAAALAILWRCLFA